MSAEQQFLDILLNTPGGWAVLVFASPWLALAYLAIKMMRQNNDRRAEPMTSEAVAKLIHDSGDRDEPPPFDDCVKRPEFLDAQSSFRQTERAHAHAISKLGERIAKLEGAHDSKPSQ